VGGGRSNGLTRTTRVTGTAIFIIAGKILMTAREALR
jgi:hypothetical protein